MNLGNNGTGIMVGWTIWVFILPLIIEILEILCINKKCKSYLTIKRFTQIAI
jgi:hypothetical protein